MKKKRIYLLFLKLIKYFDGEIDEIIGVISEEEFECGSAEVVAPKVDLLELPQREFEIGALPIGGGFSGGGATWWQSGIPEADPSAGNLKTAFDDAK